MTSCIKTWGGIGDALLLTPALRALKQAEPGTRVHVHCGLVRHYEVLQHNPHIDRLTITRLGRRNLLRAAMAELANQVRMLTRTGGPSLPWPLRFLTRFAIADYGRLQPGLLAQHATELIGQMLCVTVTDRRLEVFLTDAEERWAAEAIGDSDVPIVIHVAARYIANKHWPLARWEALVRQHSRFTFFQIGLMSEPLVPGCLDLRGRTVRKSIALIKHAQAFVGVDSCFAHATNAVGTPGVVLFGPSSPVVWGHDNNINLWKAPRCAPCLDMLRDAPCPYGVECLAHITVDEVGEALQSIIRRLPRS